jgi:hypothetical protein
MNDNTNSDGTPSDENPPESVNAVGEELAAAAEAVEVGDPAAMLATVRNIATRRRRRRNVVVGLAAAGTLAMSGVVVANLIGGDDGDDLLVSAPPTELPTTEPDDIAEDVEIPSTDLDGGSDAAGEVPGTAVVPVRFVPAQATDVVDSGLTVAADNIGQSRLLHWNNGFLSIRTTFEPQPLPTELPPEITDQFPPEVVDLFPDGLPSTIDEAIQVLQEAGLFDEVSEIVTSNQDVYDAIYAEQGEVETTVRFSADGIEWADIAADFPVADNYWTFVGTTADRMVIVSESGGFSPDPGVDTGEPATPRVADVYSSTDLVEWTSQRIPLTAPPGEFAPSVPIQIYIRSAAVTDAGFVMVTQAATEIDPLQLVPQEIRERAFAAGWFDSSYGDDGVTIEIYGDVDENEVGDTSPPQPIEVLTFTWEELGLDGPLNPGRPVSTTYVSTWDGEPTVVDGGPAGWLVDVGDEYVEIGPQPQRSANGVDWIPIAVPGDGYVDGIIETTNGAALRMSDERGNTVLYEGELESGSWTPIELPDLPETAGVELWGPNVFMLAQYDFGDDLGREVLSDSVGSQQSAEADGYRYELVVTETDENYSVTYTVTDVATGEVVVTESADGLSEEDDPFEFVQDGFGGDSLSIVDPSTGEILVSMPYDIIMTELILADGSTVDMPGPGAGVAEPVAPSHWVMASVGDGWMVERISDGSDDSRWPSGVVASGEVVLVGWSDGTFTRIAPS